VIQHYETQADEESLAEDEASFESDPETIIKIPAGLLPAVRQLLGKHATPDVGG
jgi:hypothetical protein